MVNNMKKISIASLLILTNLSVTTISLEAHANDIWLQGRVVGVTDGDTITILELNNQQHEVRLSNVDSPETSCHARKPSYHDEKCIEFGQPFGKAAKKSLSKMIYGKVVQVKLQTTRQNKIQKTFNRPLGTVYFNQIDINFEQVRNGFAWHEASFGKKNQSAEDFLKYSEAHKYAKEHRYGLWKEDNPLPPWQYRKSKNAKYITVNNQ